MSSAWFPAGPGSSSSGGGSGGGGSAGGGSAGGGGGGGSGSTALKAGISETYGQGSAVKMTYDPLVAVDLANNAINMVDAFAYGHRVRVNVDIGVMNQIFTWYRNPGQLAPTAECAYSDLADHIKNISIPAGFTDLDSQSDGLSFNSTALGSNIDPRLREASGANSANDLVMAYVLYKLYGKTTYDTLDNIFNLEDAHNMLTNDTLVQAISDSIYSSEGAASINKMFKDLLSSDPQRFFDASGEQITGIFETNSDVSGNGSWNFTEGDIIEIRIQFEFGAAITRRDGAEYQITENTEPTVTKHLSSGEKFNIRLQLVCTNI